MAESVQVMVRARPMNKREISMNALKAIEVVPERKEVSIVHPQEPDNKKVFTYDASFDEDVEQSFMYEQSAFALVNNVIAGYNGTIFAYGQTGCGKTFSMMGIPGDERLKGIIPRSFSHIIGIIDEAKDKNFLVRCAFIEIYNENIHDLIGEDTSKNMQLREHKKKGLFIQDLVTPVVKNVKQLLEWMDKGDKSRHVGATAMNQTSSRSHSIFTVFVEVEEKVDSKNSKIRAGKLNLVDLAGSERQTKTEATGDRLKEANKINLSLSALGNVIAALVSGKGKHIPYRDSKLTRLLEDSLGGNTKTLMIAAISPADDNYEETLSTLKYASRAKQIKNKPKINEDPKDALIREYQDEIQRLREQLGTGGALSKSPGPITRMTTEDKSKFTKMEALKQDLLSNQTNISNELKNQDQALEEEKRKRLEMEEKLRELQASLVEGGHRNHATKEEIEQIHKMEQNVNQRKMEEIEMSKVELAKSDQIDVITNDYDEMSEKFQKLQKMYRQAVLDVRDQENENTREKMEILDTLRYQEKELDFLRQVVKFAISDKELIKIKDNSVWEEDNDDYSVRPFSFKDKRELKNLPSLMGGIIYFNLLDNRGAVDPLVNMRDSNRNFRVTTNGKGKVDAMRVSRDVLLDSFENSTETICK